MSRSVRWGSLIVVALGLSWAAAERGADPALPQEPKNKSKATGKFASPGNQRSGVQKSSNTDLRSHLSEFITLEQGLEPNVRLHDVCDYLSDLCDVTIIIDVPAFKEDANNENVERSPVKLGPITGVRLETVVLALASQVGGSLLLEPDHLRITTKKRAADLVWGPREESEGEVEGLRRPMFPLVNTVVLRRPVDEAFQELSTATGCSVVLDYARAGERSRNPVTATFANVPLDSAVRLLAVQANLSAVLFDNVFMVTTPEHARALDAGDRTRRNLGARR